MHSFFNVDVEDVKKLDDSQARELVARLCRAELRAKGNSEAAVDWGGDQRASDDGVDVRVRAEDGIIGFDGYVPSNLSWFQVKAEPFPPSKIKTEMCKGDRGKLKPPFQELKQGLYAYVIVSTRDNCSKRWLDERVATITELLGKNQLDQVIPKFYDSRKIADWLENHPTVLTWFRHQLGAPTVGWQPLGPWAHREKDLSGEFYVDNTNRIHQPSAAAPVHVLTAIDTIRHQLSESSVAIRIVGLSGVGKTRFVQALFDDRIKTISLTLDGENIIYGDTSDVLTPSPLELLTHLTRTCQSGIFVVDNCSSELHEKLTKLAQENDSDWSLITIEYDIRDTDQAEGTQCFRLLDSSTTIVRKIVSDKFPALSHLDINRIAEFSGGNSRIAIAVASTATQSGELASLNDRTLFGRLFFQKGQEDENLLSAARAACLVYSFDIENLNTGSELSLLAEFADQNPNAFYSNIETLRKRGLAQKRGRWRAILPHAIANRLGETAIELFPKQQIIDRLLLGSQQRAGISCARRLSYLHSSQDAKQVVQSLVSEGCRLEKLLAIPDAEFEIFKLLSSVDPFESLNTLQRELCNLENYHIRMYDLSKIARQIAYSNELFDTAFDVIEHCALLELEDAPTEKKKISEIACSLFWIKYSGIHATPKLRHARIRKLLSSESEHAERLGLSLFSTAIRTTKIGALRQYEFGAHQRDYGWHPKSETDFFDWFDPIFEIAYEFGVRRDELGQAIRTELGNNFYDLWKNARVIEQLKRAVGLFEKFDRWPEAWVGIRKLTAWENPSESDVRELESLEELLHKPGLQDFVRSRVITQSPRYLEHELAYANTDEWQKREQEVEDLGAQLGNNPDVLQEIQTELMASESPYLDRLGIGVGTSCQNHSEIIDCARTALSKDKDKFIRGIDFTYGLFSSWYVTTPSEAITFLDSVIEDEVWGAHLVSFMLWIESDGNEFTRLIRAIEFDHLEPKHFHFLGRNSGLARLSIDEIITLLSKICEKPDSDFDVALALRMLISQHSELEREQIQKIASFAQVFAQKFEWQKVGHVNFVSGKTTHPFFSVLDFACENSETDEWVVSTLANLVTACHSDHGSQIDEIDGFLRPFFKHFPNATLTQIYLPNLNGEYTYANYLAGGLDSDCMGIDAPISAAPDDAVLSWCDEEPESRYQFAIEVCPILRADRKQPTFNPMPEGISSIARLIVENSPEKENIINAVADRLRPRSCSGSMASIWRSRVRFLDELKGINPECDAIVDRVKSNVMNWIENCRQTERNREANEFDRFE